MSGDRDQGEDGASSRRASEASRAGDPVDPEAATRTSEPASPADADATVPEPRAAPRPPPRRPPEAASGVPSGRHPERIGPYRILGTLGEGGMGAVYLAEQSHPIRRQVALKVVHASLRSPKALVRFTAERQAMARLAHTNVAALFEAGATSDGFPWFAMERVEGAPITEYCDRRELSIDERLDLFIQVCEGVQHAHQKGILHRDLKPSNLLVAEADGRPVPKVIDFGIAKALDEPLQDQMEELTGLRAVGTPAYMSPEALAGSADLDTRTDVYSLGVVLFQLLTGVRPRDRVSQTTSGTSPTWRPVPRPSTRLGGLEPAIRSALAKRRRTSASALESELRGDLDWIVLQATDEERERRYSSAAALADDLRRHLANEPVLACPPTRRYRLGKFVRRHRLGVVAGTVVALALVLGIVGTTVGLVRARRAETAARLEARRAEEVTDFMTGIFAVADPGEARGNSITARELLDRGAKRIEHQLGSEPLLQARLMRTMGNVYVNLGLYGAAEPLGEEALRLSLEQLGPESPEVATVLTSLGAIYQQQARYEEAAKAHRRALAIREAAFGPEHDAVAESLDSLAQVEWFLGRADEAEALGKRALAIREHLHGSGDLTVAVSLQRQGWFLGQRGRAEEAIPLLRRALTIRERALGSDHYLVAESCLLLGTLARDAGRYAEAESWTRRALDTYRKDLEPDHPSIGLAMAALGRLYIAAGRTEDAVATLRQSVEHLEHSLGPDHYEVANALGDLGLSQADLGRWGEAEKTFRRQLEILRARLPEGHELIGQALNNLGWVLSDGLHRYPEGEEVLRRAVELFEVAQPDGYWSALSRWSLANDLRDQGRWEESEPFYERAREILAGGERSTWASNPDLDQLLADYARMLRAAGREAEADTLGGR